jgi:HlyD family secretion protein
MNPGRITMLSKIKTKIKEFIKKRPAVSIGGIVVLGLVTWGVLSLLMDKDAESSIQKYTVKQGPLKISIAETGTIQPKEKLVVKNEVEGSTAITYIVDEGSTIKKGDLMIRLDSSTLSDKKVDQEIQVQKAEASNIAAIENYEVTKNQAQSDIESAKLAYDFAQLDLKKYIEGEYPDKLKEAESNITVSEEEVAQARDTLDWSKKLYEEGYLSQSELEKDTLSYTRKQLAVELKKAAKELLVNYTHKRQMAKLQSDVTQAKSALERTTRKATANVAQAEAKKAAMQAEYERQSAKLQKYKNQLEKTEIYAPADGTIIYATSAEQSQHRHGSRTEPLKVGNNVQERQELIHLPTISGFTVTMSIPESNIDKIKVGLPAQITVDSIPNVIYTGAVTSVSNVVNAEEAYMNSDLKVYDTVITLENGGNMDLLHSGMSCSAEIIIDQYEKAIYVPIQAVMSVGGKPTVFMVKGDKLKPRTVETGLDNNTVIRIASGLEPGDIISLTPPLAQAEVVEKISDLSYATTGGASSSSKPVNQNAAGSDTSSPTEGGNMSPAKEENESTGNRYSTTGSIDDSSSSGSMPGDGGMGGGGMGGGGM